MRIFAILIFVILITSYGFSYAFPQVEYNEILPTSKGTLNVGISTIPTIPTTKEPTALKIDFINPNTKKIQEHIDYKVVVTKNGESIFGPIPTTHTSTGSVKIPVDFQSEGSHDVIIEIEGILFQPIPAETVMFNILVGEESEIIKNQQPEDDNKSDEQVVISEPQGGGCLVATAAYGSELSPQVQLLREIRDNKVLSTESGSAFMDSFNTFYYSFSPTIADWERQNSVFKETVKLTITPLISSLSILNYVEINSESEMLSYGISLIAVNIAMYFVAPAFVVNKLIFRHKKMANLKES